MFHLDAKVRPSPLTREPARRTHSAGNATSCRVLTTSIGTTLQSTELNIASAPSTSTCVGGGPDSADRLQLYTKSGEAAPHPSFLAEGEGLIKTPEQVWPPNKPPGIFLAPGATRPRYGATIKQNRPRGDSRFRRSGPRWQYARCADAGWARSLEQNASLTTAFWNCPTLVLGDACCSGVPSGTRYRTA